jgi:6-pyruvoyl-tetrahydropterin synthase
MSNRKASFEVRVAKDTFKFNAAHFVAFQGFRERLHGHTYTASVRLIGSNKICSDGYVLDYGDVKKVTAKVCKELNEHFLCPMLSDVLRISIEKDPTKETQQGSVTIICEDGARFVFPESDCILLPIVHATSEELAMYLWQRILQGLDVDVLRKRGIETLEVSQNQGTILLTLISIVQHLILKPSITIADHCGRSPWTRSLVPKRHPGRYI